VYLNSAITNKVLSSEKDSFRSIFEIKWKNHLDLLPAKYSNAKQLVIGNRLRPLLICWGFLFSGKELNKFNKQSLAEFAIYIELLHKGTLLVDDLIDEDSTRHGEPSFHKEFSPSEAIILAVYLIGDSIDRIHESIKHGFDKNEVLNLFKDQGLLLKNLSKGVLEELAFENHSFASISKVKEMIMLQTSSIISNGLVSGYRFGHGKKNEINLIESVGNEIGYIFQVLNDLEPFSSPEKTINHKGNLNIDANKLRKNIVSSFILNKTKRSYETVNHEDLLDHYQTHEIIYDLKSNLRLVYENLTILLDQVSNKKLVIEFNLFLDHILKVSLKRISPKDQVILSDIFNK